MPLILWATKKGFLLITLLLIILAVMLYKILRLWYGLITGQNLGEILNELTHIPHNTRNYWFWFLGFTLQDNNFKSTFWLLWFMKVSTITSIFPAGKSRHKNVQSNLANSQAMQKWHVGFLIASGFITYLKYIEFLADTGASAVGCLVLVMTLAAASAGSVSNCYNSSSEYHSYYPWS